MARVGFEPTIPEFQRAKAVNALDQWFSTSVRPRPGIIHARARHRAAARRLRNTALDRAVTVIGSATSYFSLLQCH
jgi:hypothetical protein